MTATLDVTVSPRLDLTQLLADVQAAIAALPSPVPEPEPDLDLDLEPIKVGDRVRITEGFHSGATSIVVGTVGTVSRIHADYAGSGRTLYVVNGRTAGGVEKVAEPEPPSEPVPTTTTIAAYSREIYVRLSAVTDGARIQLGGTLPDSPEHVVIHLSRDETRTLAAALTAIANA